MHERRRRTAARSLLAVAAALVALSAPVASAPARPAPSNPVHVSASFDRDAVLGGSTALAVDLRLDAKRLSRAQLVGVRLDYPGSLGLVSSGLGLATCRLPANDFAQVLIPDSGLAGCPINSVMGYGTALAIVRLTDGQAIPEYATVTLLSGPVVHGRIGLVVYVDGQHPFGAKLAFAGEVHGSPSPYGGALAVRMPVIPGIEQLATVSLVDLRVVIGSHAIRYRERRGGRTVSYHPDGVQLPVRCPRAGFRFRAEVTFADGSTRTAHARTPCPPAVAAPGSGR
jgi:hypothetical protein